MTKAEQTRLMSWRLRVLQEAGASARNVARTCGDSACPDGHSTKWRKRHKDHGDAGLCDRPRKPRLVEKTRAGVSPGRETLQFGSLSTWFTSRTSACFDPRGDGREIAGTVARPPGLHQKSV
jgi:hypothetical protein